MGKKKKPKLDPVTLQAAWMLQKACRAGDRARALAIVIALLADQQENNPNVPQKTSKTKQNYR